MAHVLCGFSTESLKTSGDFSLLFENTVKILDDLLYILDGTPPSMFPLYLGAYSFHYTGS